MKANKLDFFYRIIYALKAYGDIHSIRMLLSLQSGMTDGYVELQL